ELAEGRAQPAVSGGKAAAHSAPAWRRAASRSPQAADAGTRKPRATPPYWVGSPSRALRPPPAPPRAAWPARRSHLQGGPRRDIPFGGGAEACIEVGAAFGHETEFGR